MIRYEKSVREADAEIYEFPYSKKADILRKMNYTGFGLVSRYTKRNGADRRNNCMTTAENKWLDWLGKRCIDHIFVFNQLFLYVIISVVMECASSADWIWNSDDFAGSLLYLLFIQVELS